MKFRTLYDVEVASGESELFSISSTTTNTDAPDHYTFVISNNAIHCGLLNNKLGYFKDAVKEYVTPSGLKVVEVDVTSWNSGLEVYYDSSFTGKATGKIALFMRDDVDLSLFGDSSDADVSIPKGSNISDGSSRRSPSNVNSRNGNSIGSNRSSLINNNNSKSTNNNSSSGGNSNSSFTSGDSRTGGKGSSKADYVKTGKDTVRYDVSEVSKKAKSAVIPSTVKIDGKTYKVTSIAPNAFAGYTNLRTLTIGANVKKLGSEMLKGCTKLKTLTVNSRNLTKKSVKNSLKGSSVRAIQAPGNKVSAYKKIFTKSNSGSKNKITVKAKKK